MRIAILATGNEIIQGDTLNTNSHQIAHLLSSEGFTVSHHLTCGDEEEAIVNCLSFLAHTHDIVIVIGGLGPTSDDRTRFALGSFLKQPLVEHAQAVKHIKECLKFNNTIDEGNYQQSLFPENATILPNPYGSAVGCWCPQAGKSFFLLPGPPRECLPMFEKFVFPKIRKQLPDAKKLLKWRLFGVSEGLIAQKLDASLAHLDCETGYRIDIPYLEFKVRCFDEQIETIKNIIEPLIQPYIIATPETRASEQLRSLINELDEPLVIIDNATGGAFQLAIQKPENHEKLFFHDLADARLRFHITGLQEYWHNEQTNKANIIIKYKNDSGEGKETHELLYYSSLVLQSAAELLSFRLFHLIQQLHN
ncbi:Competence damage inducible protein CinA (plasmid) [Legionella adelaidensis]|uniref:Competence damage inducible protein CinA n=1 Tax=Legionella adelaidensis TaxID=45056 RepID=A0A0W0R3J5_9GAMM|nr:competence/damage-inducible protein A [Legionella adelaidensis]KTC65629.1 competence damage inducible protein CinA [Legionella adelaidensis]VEH85174.1 Competence damage inducible protein CinA [Legionella adelaidensis]